MLVLLLKIPSVWKFVALFSNYSPNARLVYSNVSLTSLWMFCRHLKSIESNYASPILLPPTWSLLQEISPPLAICTHLPFYSHQQYKSYKNMYVFLMYVLLVMSTVRTLM